MLIFALRRFAYFGVAAAMLAACSYSVPSLHGDAVPSYGDVPRPRETWFRRLPTPPGAPGWLSPSLRHHPASSQPLIYVSEENKNDVVIYPERQATGSPIGVITNGVSDPWGLCVDQNESLYSVNQSGTVTKYPFGSTQPSAIYSQDLGRPLYCIVDRYGDLFVGNGDGGANGGTIVEYRAGSTATYQTFPTAGSEVDDMDFDAKGNLYAAYRGGNGSLGTSVERFAPNSAQGTVLGMRLNQPQGLIVDGNGDIVVVTEWVPGKNHLAVFRPEKTRPQLRFRQPKNSYPIQIAITQDNAALFATTFNNGGIYQTAYPLTKTSRWTFDRFDQYGLQQGIALSNGHVAVRR